jgi:hypothetical protein
MDKCFRVQQLFLRPGFLIGNMKEQFQLITVITAGFINMDQAVCQFLVLGM